MIRQQTLRSIKNIELRTIRYIEDTEVGNLESVLVKNETFRCRENAEKGSLAVLGEYLGRLSWGRFEVHT
jgi:hypothetical protein